MNGHNKILIDICANKYQEAFKERIGDIIIAYEKIQEKSKSSKMVKEKIFSVLSEIVNVIETGYSDPSIIRGCIALNNFKSQVSFEEYIFIARELLLIGGSRKFVSPLFFLLDMAFSQSQIIAGINADGRPCFINEIAEDLKSVIYPLTLVDISLLLINDDCHPNVKNHIDEYVQNNFNAIKKQVIKSNEQLIQALSIWILNNSINNKIRTVADCDTDSLSPSQKILVAKINAYSNPGCMHGLHLARNFLSSINYNWIKDKINEKIHIERTILVQGYALSIKNTQLTPANDGYLVDINYSLNGQQQRITFFSNNILWQISCFDFYEIIVLLYTFLSYGIITFENFFTVDGLILSSTIKKYTKEINEATDIPKNIKTILSFKQEGKDC